MKRFNRFQSLRSRIMAVLVLFGIVPLVLITLILLQLQSRTLTRQIEHELQQSVSVAKRKLEGDLQNSIAGQAQLAAALGTLQSAAAQQSMLATWQASDTVLDLALVTPMGQPVFDEDVGVVVDQAYLEQAVDGSHVVHYGSVAADRYTVYSPVIDTDGIVQSVLLSQFEFAASVDFLVDDDATIRLVNAGGMSVWQPDTLAPINFSVDTELLMQDTLVSYQRSEVLVVAAGATLEGTPWMVLLERPSRTLYNPVTSSRFLASIGLLLAISVTAVAAPVIANVLTKQLLEIRRLFQHFGRGDLRQRARVIDDGELGQVAHNLNVVLDSFDELLATRDDRDSTRLSIQMLLEEISDVARGDLDISAEVRPDLTGDIAQSVNQMADSLRRIVRDVKMASTSVSRMAQHVESSTTELAERNEVQMYGISDTESAIVNIVESIEQVSSNAELASTASHQARLNAQRGAWEIQNTVQGMQRIQSNAEISAERITKLTHRASLVKETLDSITAVSERTSILAINASIQAAEAGQNGRGFVVIAQEVERLAQSTSAATAEIGFHLRTMETEMLSAIDAINQTMIEVIGGIRAASAAGDTLMDIEDDSERLDSLIHAISLATQAQHAKSDLVAESMQNLSLTTRETVDRVRQTADTILELTGLIDELEKSVSQFKLNREVSTLNESSSLTTRIAAMSLKTRAPEPLPQLP